MRRTEKYSIKPTKGILTHRKLRKRGLKIIQFDAVRECSGENCVIFENCPYVKMGRCKVETNYLDAVFDSVIAYVDQAMDQGILNKITLHLMPLFHQLIRFQMYAYSLERVNYHTQQGNPAINPVFKEIRQIISKIESTQSSLGLDSEYLNALGPAFAGRGKGRGESRDPAKFGDPDYWHQMGQNFESDIFPDGPATGVKPRRRTPEEREQHNQSAETWEKETQYEGGVE